MGYTSVNSVSAWLTPRMQNLQMWRADLLSILYKGLEHPQILVSIEVPGSVLCDFQRSTATGMRVLVAILSEGINKGRRNHQVSAGQSLQLEEEEEKEKITSSLG